TCILAHHNSASLSNVPPPKSLLKGLSLLSRPTPLCFVPRARRSSYFAYRPRGQRPFHLCGTHNTPHQFRAGARSSRQRLRELSRNHCSQSRESRCQLKPPWIVRVFLFARERKLRQRQSNRSLLL